MNKQTRDGMQHESDWRELAACKGFDTNIFYPDKVQGIRMALEICRYCVVREPCLEDSLECGDIYGVRGGKSESERKKLLRRRERDAKAGEVSKVSKEALRDNMYGLF